MVGVRQRCGRGKENRWCVWRQGQAEYYLEKLHGEVEKQLEPFLNNKKTSEEWKKYRETLIGLTDVTHSHFEKLVQVGQPPPSPPSASGGCMTSASGFEEDCCGVSEHNSANSELVVPPLLADFAVQVLGVLVHACI